MTEEGWLAIGTDLAGFVSCRGGLECDYSGWHRRDTTIRYYCQPSSRGLAVSTLYLVPLPESVWELTKSWGSLGTRLDLAEDDFNVHHTSTIRLRVKHTCY